MFKRTKGYLLLTMLVLTGLAGRLHTTTLTNKERRVLFLDVKESRNAMNECTSGLSQRQLNYRKAKGKPSIKEYIYQAVSAEKFLWSMAKNALRQPGATRINMMNDECLSMLITDNGKNICSAEKKFRTAEEALTFFRKETSEKLKYIRTTTENVRVHSAQFPSYRLDAYQIMMMGALTVKDYAQKIHELRASPGFPKK